MRLLTNTKSVRLYRNQFGIVALFAVLSIIFSFVRMDVPGFEGIYTEFREVPLLIALFYLHRPALVLLLTAISMLAVFLTPDIDFLEILISHLMGLSVVWVGYRFLTKYEFKVKQELLFWAGLVVVYYFVILFPSVAFIEIFMRGKDITFIKFEEALALNTYFEVFSTVLLSTLYLSRLRKSQELERLNLSLERTVAQRTEELLVVNLKLKLANDDLAYSNANLERLVEERTLKLNQQLEKLEAYAFSNSHVVRAPLARILGLASLLHLEPNMTNKLMICENINNEAIALDKIIRNINSVLDNDSDT